MTIWVYHCLLHLIRSFIRIYFFWGVNIQQSCITFYSKTFLKLFLPLKSPEGNNQFRGARVLKLHRWWRFSRAMEVLIARSHKFRVNVRVPVIRSFRCMAADWLSLRLTLRAHYSPFAGATESFEEQWMSGGGPVRKQANEPACSRIPHHCTVVTNA